MTQMYSLVIFCEIFMQDMCLCHQTRRERKETLTNYHSKLVYHIIKDKDHLVCFFMIKGRKGKQIIKKMEINNKYLVTCLIAYSQRDVRTLNLIISITLIWVNGLKSMANGPDCKSRGIHALDQDPFSHIRSIIYLLHLCIVST